MTTITEQTPNPATLKFIPGITILEKGTLSFNNEDDVKDSSPLAIELFNVEGVKSIFFGNDFITITKNEDVQWFYLSPLIINVMDDFVSNNKKMIFVEKIKRNENNLSNDKSNDKIVAQIRELIDTRVRPAVAMDGGDITFYDFKDGIVYLSMLGACAGCPASDMTLKMGIENMLKYYLPEVEEVVAIE